MALVLVLIYETRPQSEWKPYIDILPREFDTLMFWSPEELAVLEGSAVLGKIGRDEAEEEFRSTLGPLLNTHREHFKDTEVSFDETSGKVIESTLLSCAHRMASCIMSYSFDIRVFPPNYCPSSGDSKSENVTDDEEIEHYKAMVPLADLLNADSDKNNARLFQYPTHLSMSSLCDIPAQTQLYNDYGPLPRSDLLRRYGYLTPGYAQYDIVELKGDLITEMILKTHKPALDYTEKLARLELLIEKEILEDTFDLPVPDPGRGQKNIPTEWAGIYYVLTLPPGAKAMLPSSPKTLKRIGKTQGYKSCVLDILKARLAMYPQINNVPSKTAPERTRKRINMALQVRESEIAILEELVREVEEWEVEEEVSVGAKAGPGVSEKEGTIGIKRKESGTTGGYNRKRAKN